MATEIRFADTPIGERFERIATDTNTQELTYPGQAITRSPLHSREYADCNGVALLNGTLCGLTHYTLDDENYPADPDTYLPELIDDIRRETSATPISAVLVGGDQDHYAHNKRILTNHQIPIVGSYLDSWASNPMGITIVELSEEETRGHKHVLIIPETREVLLYSQPVGYKQLFPN